MTISGFPLLGEVPPTELGRARLLLHHAAQVAAAPAPGAPELRWDMEHRALVGPTLGGGVRAGLRPEGAELLVLRGGDVVAALPVAGHDRDALRRWLAAEGVPAEDEVWPPAHPLPPHPVLEGASFEVVRADALAEIGRWLEAAARALVPLARLLEQASEVGCSVKHFDLATLLRLDPEEGPRPRTITVGLSPGDATHDEPYFYVSPWPYPEDVTLLELAGGGEWHLEGWFGAVLRGSRLVREREAQAQAARLEAFLASAVGASRAFLHQRGDR